MTASLLKEGKIAICSGCENTLREMALYCWENGGSGRDMPRKENDHAMDDMRYFAMSLVKCRYNARRSCAFWIHSR